jgi:hypothetical protein
LLALSQIRVTVSPSVEQVALLTCRTITSLLDALLDLLSGSCGPNGKTIDFERHPITMHDGRRTPQLV